ncbi:hypothetical protein PV05_00757 [Exophiala xenobiotica]|uniref:Uncharacterized protein n=1 Tax=Exophiala xenobiotica TaxID=348802 RepID=A0A0D2FK93_9EURO|nr:uncharacterized protein PV05_00757 [Exophiala xenobiotica]KIW60549.1 hypothetical protein PV05_00757 [Exophiala xenobiotica]
MGSTKVAKASESKFSTAFGRYRRETVRGAAQQVHSRTQGEKRVVTAGCETKNKKITKKDTETKSATIRESRSADCVTITTQTRITKTRTVKIKRVDLKMPKSEKAKAGQRLIGWY